MKVLVSKLLLGSRFGGMTLWPFIIVRDKALKNDSVLMNHEEIHLVQQFELFIIPFYIWYGIEFIIKWAIYKNRYLAYRNISFEREAYDQESNLFYLEHRSKWNFLRYI